MEKTGDAKAMPWTDGNYRVKDMSNMVFVVKGEKVSMLMLNDTASAEETDDFKKGTWTYGDYGEAHASIVEASGESNYNIEMTILGGKWITKGVVASCGKKIFVIGISNELDTYDWITEDQLTALREEGDSVDAPSSHYKIQPEYQGKLLWISGPPGAGKSTSGQMLSKTAGYVYYEADCFMFHANPYIPTDVVEPSLGVSKQKPLKGCSKERIRAAENGLPSMMKMMARKEYDMEPILVFYSSLCQDILNERKRLGGDFAITQAVATKEMRDHIRAELGPDLVFVILNLSKDEQEDRAKGRHSGQAEFAEFLSDAHEFFEPAAEDEPNTIEVEITRDLTREDVRKQILDKVDKLNNNNNN